MFLELYNEKYTVLSRVEVKPPLKDFDVVHNTENIKIDDFYMARIFRSERNDGQVTTFALIDQICSGYEPYAVLSENMLTIILFSAIVRINLDTGLIVQYTECANMGGLFEIHPIDGGYIIWGEGEIFRYDLDLKQVWRRSGRDILVSQEFDRSFWIELAQIHYRDWEGWHYIIDLDGNPIDNFYELPVSKTL